MTRSNDNFWENVSRYPRYLITFILGTFYAIYTWLKPLAKKPVMLVAIAGFLLSGLLFTILTLRAMLGLSAV
ncbi:DUF751 family protein [Baaleninema simplex]|uniref:DUF751 family protein n=1 Tax=Baaleninema simplex TaxID=2862350 RepID=UPI000344EA47|nr:DUF751 family protein [Baaleninema simplex]